MLRKWEDEPLHLFVSFGAGIFMGVVFLHVIPESLTEHNQPIVSLMLLLGFLLIFFVEKFLLTHASAGVVNEHKAVAITVLLGLSVHSLIEGMGLALFSITGEFDSVLFYSILAHKIPAAISLVSLFLLARISKRNVIILLLLFSAMTPVSALISYPVFSAPKHSLVEILSALTAGTLLYVATGELLPEVFHTSSKRWLKLLLLISGMALIAVVELYYG